MKVSMARVMIASEAVWPLMEARGLRAATQMGLLRLWKRIAEERNLFCAAEANLAREYGTLRDNGQIEFRDEADAAEYTMRRGELFREEVEVEPEVIGHDAALWAALTPKALMQLEGLLMIEEEMA